MPHSEASFAALCRVSAPSRRHRARRPAAGSNRGGDRQANSALYTIAIARLRWDRRTQDYVKHAANGVIRVRRPLTQNGAAALLRNVLRPAVAELGGTLVVLSAAAADRLGRDDVWGKPADGIAVMRALKKRFDPAGILNPGRFVY